MYIVSIYLYFKEDESTKPKSPKYPIHIIHINNYVFLILIKFTLI